MLRELTEKPEALQFTDIYPEYRSRNQDEYTSYSVALGCTELPEDGNNERRIIRF